MSRQISRSRSRLLGLEGGVETKLRFLDLDRDISIVETNFLKVSRFSRLSRPALCQCRDRESRSRHDRESRSRHDRDKSRQIETNRDKSRQIETNRDKSRPPRLRKLRLSFFLVIILFSYCMFFTHSRPLFQFQSPKLDRRKPSAK
jgi:hypothetical protein